MAEQQTIKYAPQWTNMTVDNVIFQTNNVVGNFNYPPNVPAYKPIMKFLRNCPLYNAFTNCPSVVYQNFLREFWSTVVAFDPFPSTDEPEKRPLKEFLIKFLVVKKELGNIAINPSYLDKTPVLKNSFPVAWRILFTFVIQVLGGNYSSTEQVNSIQQLLAYSLITGTEVDIGEIIYSDLVTKLLNKSRLKYVSYPRFISCALQVLLGSEYTQDKKFRFLPPILSNSNFTKDPSKVTDIELTAHMIAVNNRRDSVSPPPLAAKPKKGKSQTVASTLPKSQGPEASGALSKKRKKPKSKRPPTETKESPPKPTEGSEQSHSVSSGTVPDPQDLERDIQLASTGLPSTLDEGTRQSKPLPEGTATHPKDSGVNKQPLDRDITSTTSNEGTAKTTPLPKGSLGDKDLEGNIIDKGKGIANESEEDPSKKLVPASTIVHRDPDEEIKVPYMINGKMYYLTDKEMQAYLDKEEKLRKAAEEERLLAISKPEVIKVVQEEAEKIGLDPKKIASAKAGEKFKKAQEAEHQTINSRLKPETITDIKIHPKTKPVVITVYRGTDGRNFDVHKPFAFGAFGISELDELREIIPKKKNTVVQDLMNSLSRRYERIRKIPEELGIKSALPAPAPAPALAPAPEQASSKSLRKKRKHMKLKPGIKIPGLEFNRALPENVLFVNNMVIKEPEYGIFFTDEFGDQAFQRWSDIDKVRMEALVSYLVAASMVQSP
ncbi:hypothetical protein Tco_0481948 [Tanacetum coccineum]